MARGIKHPPELKEEALRLAKEVGPLETSKMLGLKSGTVRAWVCLAKKKANETAQQSVEPFEEEETTASTITTEKAVKTRKKIAKVYTPSERARALEYVGKFGVTETHRMLGISRYTLYDWARKAELEAEGKLVTNMFSGPDEDPRVLRDRHILEEWKRHPGLGPSQICNQLRRNGMKTSVNTVRRVMEEDGYVPPKVRRTNSHDKRYEAIRPNHLWHLDFFHRYINKQKIFVLLIVDDFSRFIVGYCITKSENADSVLRTFEKAVNRYGRPEMVMSDGGSAFHSWKGVSGFTRLLEELGVDHIIAHVPQVNGKLEVLNGNVQKELFNHEKFFDLAQTELHLKGWIDFYNFRRTHQALGGLLVPGDRYFGRAEEVLAQIERGLPPEGVGEPSSISERTLDLLRVTSRKGEIVVKLMGNALWSSKAI